MATPRREAARNGTYSGTGMPGDAAPSRFSPYKPFGVGGAAVFAGRVQEFEKDSALSGTEKFRTYSDFLNRVSTLAASVRLFTNLAAKPAWKAEPANDSAKAQEYAELVEDILNDMLTPWPRVVRRASMYRFYGFAAAEWTAKKRDDGVIGLMDIAPRPQQTIDRWLELDEWGDPTGVVQISPQNFLEYTIPRKKLLYLVDDAIHDSPEGLGLFRHTVEACRRIIRYEFLEGIGFETDLRGVPIGRAPIAELQELVRTQQIDQAEMDAILRPIDDFIEGHIRNTALGLRLDSGTYTSQDERQSPSATQKWGMELMTGGGNSQADIRAAIQDEHRNVARILNTQMILLGGDSRGALALSEDFSSTLALVVDQTVEDIRAAVQSDIVRRIADLNGWADEDVPNLVVSKVQMRDVSKIAQAMKDLAAAGAPMVPDDPAEEDIRAELGVRAKPKMDELVELGLVPDPSEPPPAPPDGQGSGGDMSNNADAKQQTEGDGDNVDNAADAENSQA